MSVIIPFGAHYARFDINQEATEAAVGEACAGAAECSLGKLCPECDALRIGLVARLIRAYKAGRASMMTEDSDEKSG